MKIGELYVTYQFDTPALAKEAWELVRKRCRYLGTFRWADPDDLERQFITVLAERDAAGEFERASQLLARTGSGVLTPPDTLGACRARRQKLADEGGKSATLRSPGGFRVDRAGNLHPVRKPQG